ncbi:MAG: hypothetical protein COB02_12465 [Candidatus Cloacimonadota bacterium]|nr:MAG: hypothetical protein COB02_12465 [Candidatus Cloacimonadota bacterium]
MKQVIILVLGVVIGYAASFYFIKPVTSKPKENTRIKSKKSLYQRLFIIEEQYHEFIEKKKKEVIDVYNSKNVQKLRRGPLRKSYSFEAKSDSKESTIRFSFYTVKQNKNKLEMRAVFDDFRSKLIWDRLLKVMAKEALKSNKEEVKQSNDKMSSMISMVMKGSGLSQIKNRSQFHHLQFMGDDVLIFWDSIYKKCSQKKRKLFGIKKCVKGIFIGEIDLRNTVRDFYRDEINNKNIGWAQYRKNKKSIYLSNLFPSDEQNNVILYEKLKESYKMGVPLTFKIKENKFLVYPSQKQSGSIIYLKE